MGMAGFEVLCCTAGAFIASQIVLWKTKHIS